MAENGTNSVPPETPEWAKSILYVWHHLREHAEVLMKPPVLLAYLIVAALGYYAGHSTDSEKIEVQNERIAFLNDQVAAYKDRLQGATPDEAAKKIAELQKKVAGLIAQLNVPPREISDPQGDLLQAQLVLIKDKIKQPIMVAAVPDREAIHYAIDFITVFDRAGIPMPYPPQAKEKAPQIVYTNLIGDRGVDIGVQDSDHPPEVANLLFDALWRAGIVAEIVDSQDAYGDTIELAINYRPAPHP